MLAIPEFCAKGNQARCLQAMSIAGTNSTSETSAFPVDLLILYQDSLTGMRAAKCLDHVRELCGGVVDIRVALLKMDFLLQPEFREVTDDNALAAELVLMSLHGDRPLEVSIERWLTTWISRHTDDRCALGVLFDADKQGAGPVNQTLFRLEEVVRQGPADLLVGFGPSVENRADAPLEQIQRGIQPFFMTTAGTRGQFDGNSHWGLNE